MRFLIVLATFLTFTCSGWAQTNPPDTTTPLPSITQSTPTITVPAAPAPIPGVGGSISVGTIAADVLNWLMVAFGSTAGSIIVWILVRVLKKLGIDATDALRARLQEIVVNGLNLGAAKAEADLQNKMPIEIKSAVVETAVEYAQSHGADTLKALGLDPNSGKAVEAIKARIETAIADPAAPTPAVLEKAA